MNALVESTIPRAHFFEAPQSATRREIFGWWESRRLTFNLWVGFVGVFTWLSVLIAGSAAVKPGVDFEEPLAMIIGPFFYAIMANICYTAGPFFDMIFYKKSPRVALLRIGFWFSLLLTAIPRTLGDLLLAKGCENRRTDELMTAFCLTLASLRPTVSA